MNAPDPSLYLAHPIDQATNSSFAELVTNLKAIATSRGLPVYLPSQAWSLNPTKAVPSPVLQQVNDFALFHASHALVVLPAGVASIGTPYELAQAVNNHLTRVGVVYDSRLTDTSWLLPFIRQQVDLAVAYSPDTLEIEPGGLEQLHEFLGHPTSPKPSETPSLAVPGSFPERSRVLTVDGTRWLQQGGEWVPSQERSRIISEAWNNVNTSAPWPSDQATSTVGAYMRVSSVPETAEQVSSYPPGSMLVDRDDDIWIRGPIGSGWCSVMPAPAVLDHTLPDTDPEDRVFRELQTHYEPYRWVDFQTTMEFPELDRLIQYAQTTPTPKKP